MSNSLLATLKANAAEHRSFLLLMVFYVLLSTFMLDNYPRVWVDEPWESITASTLIHEGKMYNPVLENYIAFDKILLQPRLFLSLALAPSYALFGVGPAQGRVVSVACGALLIAGVYLFTKKFFSQRAALVAVWFTLIETMMFFVYRTIRPEIYLATLELFSLLFFFSGIETGRSRNFFWSGLLSGIALWTHPNALLHLIALSVVLLLTYRARTFTSRGAWFVAAGVAAGVFPYLAYVAVNDAQNSFATFYLQLDNRTGALGQSHWLSNSLAGEWGRVLEYMRFPYRAPIVLAFAAGWGYAMLSRKKPLRTLAIVLGVEALCSFFFISSKTVLYSTSVLPLLCIIAAGGIDENLGELQALPGRFRRVFRSRYWKESLAGALFIILSLNQLAGDASLLWQHRSCSYSETIGRLQSAIPQNARVWGSITFWFGFQHQPFRCQYTYLREVERFKPEYMITGDAETWGKDFWRSVRDQAEEIVKQRGTLVAELPENCYGKLRVYHLHW
ncbi:MAG TPA: glycosyltransferase family 39 protein [Bacteroidota bacterium]|nr:glycosyltransferase family 39 protein [Bacteroidota bacterium]